MIDEDGLNLFDKLTALDPKPEKKKWQMFKKETKNSAEEQEELMKLIGESYNDLFNVVKVMIEDGYADITAFALFQVLVALLSQMKEKDKKTTQKLIDKFAEKLKRV